MSWTSSSARARSARSAPRTSTRDDCAPPTRRLDTERRLASRACRTSTACSPRDDALAEAERSGIAYLPYFPLASGLLTGKFRRGAELPAGSRIERFWTQEQRDAALTEQTWDRIESLEAFATDRGHTLLELAFAWLLSQSPVASVIAGATRPEQVRANAAAASWRLERTEVDALR